MELYNNDIDTLIRQFSSNVQNGLEENTIQSAKQKFGKNILKISNTRSAYRILFGQFASPLIIILIVAALASFYLQQPRDGLILLIIVGMNALIGFLPGVEIRKHTGVH